MHETNLLLGNRLGANCAIIHTHGHTLTCDAYIRARSLSQTNLVPAVFSIGCAVLYTGQGKYHSSTTNTLEYVVHQANTTSEKLRNVSEYLSAAKKVGVNQMFLPSNVQSDIDRIQTKINSSASALASTTEDNSNDIKNLIDSV